jgi:hypothetical protein
MSRVVIVHWNRDVSPLVAALSKARYEVEPRSPQGMPGLRGVRDDPPDAFVIDPERRPSDGREVGASLRRLVRRDLVGPALRASALEPS